MSNPQAEKLTLENLGKLHQMKINTRLTALQAAQTLMGTPGYLPVQGGGGASKVDIVTLLAQAQMIEEYILGNIEKESTEAMETARQRINGPKIIR